MRQALFLWLIIGMVACQATLSELRPSLEDESGLYLYLQPLSQEAGGLRFTLDEVLAVDAEGRAFPLELRLREIHGNEARRQRLLAQALLPPGPYQGFTFKVGRASLKGEEGELRLRPEADPARVDFSFLLTRKKTHLVCLTFNVRQSIPGDGRFFPAFSPFIPSKPLASLSGYVSNRVSNTITVFDKRAGQVAGVIATGKGPAGMALDQKRGRLYVALSGEDSIEVVDVQAGESLNRVKLTQGDGPQELGLTPDGGVLLVVNTGSNSVSFLDPLSLFELGRLNVGNGPQAVTIDMVHGKRAYVFNRLSGTISVLDLQNRTILTTLSTDPGPLRGALNRRGDRLYVIHESSPFLSVLNTATLTVERRFRVGMGVYSVQVDPRTDLVFLSRRHDPVIEIHDPNAFVPVDTLRPGGSVVQMTVDGEEGRLYLVSEEGRRLIVSSLVGTKKVYQIDVDEGSYGVSLMGER